MYKNKEIPLPILLLPDGVGGLPPERKEPIQIRCSQCGQIVAVDTPANGEGFKRQLTEVGKQICPVTGGDHRVPLA